MVLFSGRPAVSVGTARAPRAPRLTPRSPPSPCDAARPHAVQGLPPPRLGGARLGVCLGPQSAGGGEHRDAPCPDDLVNAVEHSFSPLMCAAMNGHCGIVRLLLQEGAGLENEPQQKGGGPVFGDTALTVAAERIGKIQKLLNKWEGQLLCQIYRHLFELLNRL